MLRIKRYEHTNTKHEKDKTKARKQPKNANKYCVFVNKKPKPNTFVFDLGLDWRRKRDSPYSENGRVYSHSGACNGEFGGAAACNHILIAQNLSFDGKKPD